MSAQLALGLDLGGTNIKAALVDEAGRMLTQRTSPTDAEQGPDVVIDRMVTLSRQLLDESSVHVTDLVGLGIGCPGPLKPSTGVILRAPNLPGWIDVPLRDRMESNMERPVVVENDGNAAAFGESWVGAGRTCQNLVMLTLGTGVGAGIVIDGRIHHGHFENAGEIGHTIVVPDGLPCVCGQRGCLEQYASASGLARNAMAAMKHHSETGELKTTFDRQGTVTAEDVAQCAANGDEGATKLWEEACRYLAVACVNIQHNINPAMIVIGGGLANAGPLLIDRVRHHFAELSWSLYDDAPSIVPATLGYDAGVVGAAGLLLATR